MFYRVTADITFDIDDEAADFYHDCEFGMDKANLINPDTSNPILSHILIQRCYHDEDPIKPCEIIAEEDNEPPVMPF